ncbi:MAG: hypothetical protein ACRD0K_26530, partial [Egibacteraceae bacterium]
GRPNPPIPRRRHAKWARSAVGGARADAARDAVGAAGAAAGGGSTPTAATASTIEAAISHGAARPAAARGV